MTYDELIPKRGGTAAKIAREIVQACNQNFVGQDVGTAVNQALARFYDQMRKEAQRELRMTRMQLVPQKQRVTPSVDQVTK